MDEVDMTTANPSDLYHNGVLPQQEANNADLIAKLRATAYALAKLNPEGITSDDIHAACPLPPNVDPRIMGAAFEKGKWRSVGWRPTTRKSRHGAPIRVWKLAS